MTALDRKFALLSQGGFGWMQTRKKKLFIASIQSPEGLWVARARSINPTEAWNKAMAQVGI